ncbi:lipoprotein [Sinorhizobium sp. RAC02]|uniref:lipoprotein n=1 Tax=Sinorhizobium sp. RAC02 TaxID=1842534 RepID=UPI00336BD61C
MATHAATADARSILRIPICLSPSGSGRPDRNRCPLSFLLSAIAGCGTTGDLYRCGSARHLRDLREKLRVSARRGYACRRLLEGGDGMGGRRREDFRPCCNSRPLRFSSTISAFRDCSRASSISARPSVP